MRASIRRLFPFFTLFAALVPLLLAGCATGPAFTPVSSAPPGQSLVYVYRKGNFVGAATESHIFVNGKHLTKLRNSAYAPAFVPPGPVLFSTLRRVSWGLPGMAVLSLLEQKENERLCFDALSGRTYYVRWSIGDKMTLVDESTGAKEIQGLRLSGMDGDK